MIGMRWLRPSAAAALVGAAGLAQAALTPTAPACSATVTAPSWSDCAGSFAGNDKNQQADVLATILADFGVTASFAGASDDGGSGPFATSPGGDSGTLTFDVAIDDAFVLSLKAGNAFSLFYFDGSGAPITSIDYTTLGVSLNAQDQGNGLSHASLYATVPSIPEPHTLALMGAGLAMVVFLSARRRN